MSNTGNNNLQMVEANWEEIEQKVRAHRRKQLKITVIFLGVCAALTVIYYVYAHHKTYDDYRIIQTVERSDTAAAHFLEFNGNLLKYSNDGAAYVTSENEIIWNQSFEMQEPIVAVCHGYVAFADSEGQDVYIMNESGTQGEFSVTMPVVKLDVSANGTAALLMEEDGTSYLALYSKEGEQLAEGAIHVENGGTPMDIALSKDGKSLVVTSMDIQSGSAASTVSFYDFSTVGENKVDHIVGTFSYPDTVIPEVIYTNSDRVLAFADNGVYTFTGGSAPAEAAQLTVEEEIKGIFYDENYFALVFADGNDEAKRKVSIYSLKCSEEAQFQTDFSFQEAQFLDNHEICLTGESACAIYTVKGVQKFSYEFEDQICQVLHVRGCRRYDFVLQNETQQVLLKLFGSAAEETQ